MVADHWSVWMYSEWVYYRRRAHHVRCCALLRHGTADWQLRDYSLLYAPRFLSVAYVGPLHIIHNTRAVIAQMKRVSKYLSSKLRTRQLPPVDENGDTSGELDGKLPARPSRNPGEGKLNSDIRGNHLPAAPDAMMTFGRFVLSLRS